MTMHDERWTLDVAENGDVRLHDVRTGRTWRSSGPRALADAVGLLADWREAYARGDVMSRARLANGGRGETAASPGRFASAAGRNVHCSNCGDTRGGPAGHETSECFWRPSGADQ